MQQLSLSYKSSTYIHAYIYILKGVRKTQNLTAGTISTIWTLYINIVRNYPLHYPCNLSLLLGPFSTHNSTSHLGEGKRRCGAAVVVQSWKGMFFFVVPNVFLFGVGGKKRINKVWIYIAILDPGYFLKYHV